MVGQGKWELPATLTMPRNAAAGEPVPAVVLVHGSGPSNRDETIGPNKPFKDLAWGLASRGIAVLRYDKRTKVHGAAFTSEEAASFTVKEETIDDAVLAVKLLKTIDGIDPDRVFVVGHSLGATVGPRIAQACNPAEGSSSPDEDSNADADTSIAGLVMMAPTARNLADLMVEQMEYLANLDGQIDEKEAAQIQEARAAADKIKSGSLKEGEVAPGHLRLIGTTCLPMIRWRLPSTSTCLSLSSKARGTTRSPWWTWRSGNRPCLASPMSP